MLNVFVICTGNSCRSVMAEALFNHLGQGRIQAFSAGSHPIGKINAGALATLKRHHLPCAGYTSQSWEDFTDKIMDIVITVCDNAAGETCPVYLSKAVRAHWGVSDPGHVEGTVDEKITAFEKTFGILQLRIQKMLALPLETMRPEELTTQLNAIGKLSITEDED
ncbi:ArsC family transcriptional regulator [Methyloprofundus sedimenti]|uniref:ArsC family transcriptional regulator n=1 Tax=Methyloprofundus sedimenti TaxID=1420851 RepID=A0A1V8M2D4_9GAMM|nr:arsenate reductase ArsC [Methyloprofundus sedimenti]OQK15714.1 ArsC family transcriptional regulator [Methyloprofundus sedimenti]